MAHISNDLTVSITFLFHKISGQTRWYVSNVHLNSKHHDPKNAWSLHQVLQRIFQYLSVFKIHSLTTTFLPNVRVTLYIYIIYIASCIYILYIWNSARYVCGTGEATVDHKTSQHTSHQHLMAERQHWKQVVANSIIQYLLSAYYRLIVRTTTQKTVLTVTLLRKKRNTEITEIMWFFWNIYLLDNIFVSITLVETAQYKNYFKK